MVKRFLHSPVRSLPQKSLFVLFYWSVGPRRPSDQSDVIVTGFLYMFVSIFPYLVVGFRPRFHSSHLAPSEGSCLKRQPTLR